MAPIEKHLCGGNQRSSRGSAAVEQWDIRTARQDREVFGEEEFRRLPQHLRVYQII